MTQAIPLAGALYYDESEQRDEAPNDRRASEGRELGRRPKHIIIHQRRLWVWHRRGCHCFAFVVRLFVVRQSEQWGCVIWSKTSYTFKCQLL